MRKGWESWDCSFWRWLRGILQMSINTWMKEHRARTFPVVPSDMTRGNGQKLKPMRFPLNIREHFFIVRRLSTGIDCSEWNWSLQSWRYQKATWTWSWATGSRWPCLSLGLDQMISRGPFQPQPSRDCVTAALESFSKVSGDLDRHQWLWLKNCSSVATEIRTMHNISAKYWLDFPL